MHSVVIQFSDTTGTTTVVATVTGNAITKLFVQVGVTQIIP